MNKNILFIIGASICTFLLSGLPAYYISLFSRPVGQYAVFYYAWLFFSTPSGVVSLAWLIKGIKKENIPKTSFIIF